MNGETEFEVTKETIEHFRGMEAHQFDGVTEEDRALLDKLDREIEAMRGEMLSRTAEPDPY